MRRGSAARRIAATAATVATVAAVALLLFGAPGGYTVTATFPNAAQLVEGNEVRAGGVPIGSVTGIRLTDDAQVAVTLQIADGRYAPLRRGTTARIRQSSLAGIANRFVDLSIPPGSRAEIPDGGTIPPGHTTAQVEVDQVFNTLDAETRAALQGTVRGLDRALRGRTEQANAGLRYLNPALASSRRLFDELAADAPLLERFLLDSARLARTLAQRRDRIARLTGDLARVTRALGSDQQALADALSLTPPFLRRANTTLVNLRAAIGDLDSLVAAARPAARRLGPVLADARAFAAGAQPAVRDLSLAIRRPGRGNDVVDLLATVPPLADIALVTRERTAAPGGRAVDVGRTRGALPELAEALEAATPEIALGRPYTTDLLGWFDDFSTTGAGFDVFGAFARAQVNLSEALPPNPGEPVRRGQYRRCPGSAEAPALDRSNVLDPELRERLACEEEDRAVGDVP